MNSKENIVISGVAGRFPESDNVKELEKNLFKKTEDTRRFKNDILQPKSCITSHIVNAIMKIIGLEDLKMIERHVPLPQLGMDSISVFEIKKTLEQEFDMILNISDIWTLNFEKLENMQKLQVEKKNEA